MNRYFYLFRTRKNTNFLYVKLPNLERNALYRNLLSIAGQVPGAKNGF